MLRPNLKWLDFVQILYTYMHKIVRWPDEMWTRSKKNIYSNGIFKMKISVYVREMNALELWPYVCLCLTMWVVLGHRYWQSESSVTEMAAHWARERETVICLQGFRCYVMHFQNVWPITVVIHAWSWNNHSHLHRNKCHTNVQHNIFFFFLMYVYENVRVFVCSVYAVATI